VDPEKNVDLTQRVLVAQERLHRFFALDRSNPILSVNLTMQQLKVLLLLYRQDGIASQELTRLLGVAMATVSGLIDRLVAHDYVARQEDSQDRRVRRLFLTMAGRRVVEEIMDAGAEHQRRLFARLDDDTLRMLEIVLHRIADVALAEAAEQGQPIPE
jgi:DNA-binding MarR family transcriptional regulator